ncbi:MAG: helix-turn-helix domain-containing protein [Burkholderiaceae bacterium]|nr:helix-turn-helix domain-containing protein [Burkholderiaceae bacterium]
MDDLRGLIARAGGPARLARALGITPAAVSQWQRVPAERLHQVAALLGQPASRLRPDLFPGAGAGGDASGNAGGDVSPAEERSA